ncbi:unnamed protein product [Brugia timori]|uniref:Uncharacterized protein n=1 Tax=Brugia timori TaxID=42155 RepID=A0A0R3RBY3_9BILA|nr:unnamed protein product [Brugia timori]
MGCIISIHIWSYDDDDDDDDDNDDNDNDDEERNTILSSDDPHYREQSPSGDRFKVDSDYFVFRTRSVAVEFLVSIKFFFSKKKCFS